MFDALDGVDQRLNKRLLDNPAKLLRLHEEMIKVYTRPSYRDGCSPELLAHTDQTIANHKAAAHETRLFQVKRRLLATRALWKLSPDLIEKCVMGQIREGGDRAHLPATQGPLNRRV